MKVYLIHPDLTIGSNKCAIEFLNVCEQELNEHIITSVIKSKVQLQSVIPEKDDMFLFFNQEERSYSDEFSSLIADIVEIKSADLLKTDLFPISITRDSRPPHPLIRQVQSYDVIEQLRNRALTENYIETIAKDVARTIIARCQPTLSIERMNLFISHRRLDGEEIAAAFDRELRIRAKKTFRDLIDVRVGEDAQEVIEERLRQSDAVILLDTPKTWESDWVDKEIKIAISMNIPIVWVRLGAREPQNKLKTQPGIQPHFELDKIHPLDVEIESDFVDEVIHKAFKLSREYAKSTFDQMRRMKKLAKQMGIDYTLLDNRNMIYKVCIPREGFKYKQRPMTHIIQYYGRLPKQDDISKFAPSLQQLGYDPHPDLGPIYDASFLLGPIPRQKYSPQEDTDCIIDSMDEYIGSIESLLVQKNQDIPVNKGIILSGAFPDCEPDFQQVLTDAIYCLSQMIFSKGLTLIFGAHPTFQHLIFDMGKRYHPANFKEYIRMYISKLYANDYMIKEYSEKATLFPTEAIGIDREKSLTLMRQSMINDDRAIALIALGGKTDANGHSPGIDEEIYLARQKGIPVFIIGSVGGRTAQLTIEMQENNWKNTLNGLTDEENKEMMLSRDFRMIGETVFNSLNLV